MSAQLAQGVIGDPHSIIFGQTKATAGQADRNNSNINACSDFQGVEHTCKSQRIRNASLLRQPSKKGPPTLTDHITQKPDCDGGMRSRCFGRKEAFTQRTRKLSGDGYQPRHPIMRRRRPIARLSRRLSVALARMVSMVAVPSDGLRLPPAPTSVMAAPTVPKASLG